MHDVIIKLDKKYNIEWKHAFEKTLDDALIHLGFARTGSCVNEDNSTEIYFRQFGFCIKEEVNGRNNR